MNNQKPEGVGIGLRPQHYTYILENKPETPWLEAITENYMGEGGMPLYYLEKIRENYPITFHGAGMSLGSKDPLNMDYMKMLKSMIQAYQPLHVSDHLAWVSFQKQYSHQLLPIPYTEDTLQHLADKISCAQDYLGQSILIENPSSYMSFSQSDIQEWDFLNQLPQMTGCKILLDVNNLYVSAFNTEIDADQYIQLIDKHSIEEIHLAGFEDRGNHLYDTHGKQVHDPVWQLYKQLIELSGTLPSLIEWDTNIPDFCVLQNEAKKAQQILDQYAHTVTQAMATVQ